MGTILSLIKTKRDNRDTYRCSNTPSSESKFDTNCLLDGFEWDQSSEMGNSSCHPNTDLGVIMPRDCTKIEMKSDGESAGQPENDEQKVIEQMRTVGKQVFGLHKLLHINRMLNESVVGTKNCLVDLQLYLIDVEEYLKTVPAHLHQTQEYEKLKQRCKEATIACGYADQWLQSSNAWYKCASDEALLIDGMNE